MTSGRYLAYITVTSLNSSSLGDEHVLFPLFWQKHMYNLRLAANAKGSNSLLCGHVYYAVKTIGLQKGTMNLLFNIWAQPVQGEFTMTVCKSTLI